MMTKEKFSFLGRGIYGISEAARYAGLHPNRVSAWFNPRAGMIDRPVFASDYAGRGMPKTISFLNLIEVLVVGHLRAKGIPLQKIRLIHGILSKDLGICYPFSHKYLYTHSKNVFAKVVEKTGDTVLYEVVTHQEFSEELVREHLDHIEYNETSRLAERWHIAKGVIIDPCICFGKPTIKGTGTETLVLAKSFWANYEDADFVGSLFDVATSDVRNAVAFESRFGSRKVA